MAFNIPNQVAAAFARQAAWHSSDIDALVAALAGDGVLSGLAGAAQGSPDMTVAIAAGQARVQGYFPFYAGGNATITTADATNPRIDIISIDYNGAITVTAGTAAAAPVAPALPANNALLAQVYVSAGVTAIGSNRIIDKRSLVPDYFDIAGEFMGSSLSATAATSAGSIGECGWTMSASGTAGASTFQTSTAAHPGVLRSVSGGTSGNNVRFHHGNAANTAVIAASNFSRARFIVSIPTITSIAAKLGMGQDVSVATANQFGTAGAWVEFVPATSAKWSFNTREASTSTTNLDTGAGVVAGNWYQFDIVRLQNGNVQFAKNGVLAFTHSTNVPTTVCNIGTLAHTLTAAARNIDHDFYGLNLAPLGNRFT